MVDFRVTDIVDSGIASPSELGSLGSIKTIIPSESLLGDVTGFLDPIATTVNEVNSLVSGVKTTLNGATNLITTTQTSANTVIKASKDVKTEASDATETDSDFSFTAQKAAVDASTQISEYIDSAQTEVGSYLDDVRLALDSIRDYVDKLTSIDGIVAEVTADFPETTQYIEDLWTSAKESTSLNISDFANLGAAIFTGYANISAAYNSMLSGVSALDVTLTGNMTMYSHLITGESDAESVTKSAAVASGSPTPHGPTEYIAGGTPGFLYKPTSSSDGKLAVLLPTADDGGQCSLYTAVSNGKGGWQKGTLIETGAMGATGGDRVAYRFSKPGSGYANGTDPIIVSAKRDYIITNTNTRYEAR